MDRRDFLRVSGLASASIMYPTLAPPAFAQASGDKWRTFEVTTQVEVLKPLGITRVWIPTPLTNDTAYHKTLGNEFKAEGGTSGIVMEGKYGAGMVWAEWPDGVRPVLTHTAPFATRDIAVDWSKPSNPKPEDKAVLAKYTAATEYLPTDGIVRKTALDATRRARSDVDKARAIYEWIVENTYRDPKTRGCGTGDIKFMLENKAMGGKCADLNALFVALARAEGQTVFESLVNRYRTIEPAWPDDDPLRGGEHLRVDDVGLLPEQVRVEGPDVVEAVLLRLLGQRHRPPRGRVGLQHHSEVHVLPFR